MQTSQLPDRAVVKHPIDELSTDFGNLSQREEQVLSYAAAGLIDKQIGRQLGISVNTLRTYWQRIRSKMGDTSRSALAAAYVTHVASLSEPATKGGFVPDWEIDLITNRYHVLSDKPNPQRHLDGADLEDVLASYVPEDQPALRRLAESLRAGDHDSVFLHGRYVTPEGLHRASSYIHVLRDKNGKPIKLLGQRVAVIDVSAEPEPDHDWEVDVATDMIKRTSSKYLPQPVEVGGSISLEEVISNYHPDDQPKLRALAISAKKGLLDSFSFAGRVITEDGLVPTGGYVYTERDHNGKPCRLIGKRTLSFNLSGEGGMVIAIGTFSRDLSTGVLQISSNLREMFHLKSGNDDLIGAIAHRIQPEQAASFKTLMRRALLANIDRTAATYRATGDDGNEFWLRVELHLSICDNLPAILSGKIIAFN